MDKKLFADLVESLKQHGEIIRGERAPERVTVVDDKTRRVATDEAEARALAMGAKEQKK